MAKLIAVSFEKVLNNILASLDVFEVLFRQESLVLSERMWDC